MGTPLQVFADGLSTTSTTTTASWPDGTTASPIGGLKKGDTIYDTADQVMKWFNGTGMMPIQNTTNPYPIVDGWIPGAVEEKKKFNLMTLGHWNPFMRITSIPWTNAGTGSPYAVQGSDSISVTSGSSSILSAFNIE